MTSMRVIIRRRGGTALACPSPTVLHREDAVKEGLDRRCEGGRCDIDRVVRAARQDRELSAG